MSNPVYEKLKQSNKLPSPTGVAMEILRLTSDERATIEAISSVVQSDPALAGRMLKLVNSPFTGVVRRIASVPDAVKLLGLRTIRGLALGLSLVTSHRRGGCRAFDYEAFWSESLARAVAARQLAIRLRSFPPEEAFTTGLLSKVGCLALATACPEAYASVLERFTGDSGNDLARLEREALGIDHATLSAEMMADWHLPEVLCEAVRSQVAGYRTGEQPDARVEQLLRMLHLAGSVACVLVRKQTTLESLTALVAEAGELHIDGEAFDPFFGSVAEEWRQAGVIFSIATRPVASLEELQAQAQHRSEPARVDQAGDRPGTGPTESGSELEPLRILIVDDDAASLRLLETYLTTAGYQVCTATSGAEALEKDRREPAQIIIADWQMPEMDGLELCRRLRAHEGLGFVYIIVLTAQSERHRVVGALDAGADDFMTKPYSREELVAHVRAGERIVRLEADLARRTHEIARYNAELTAANDRLRVMATTDELTGLANRREGLARLEEHWQLATRHGELLACIVADIDHFKRFNDTHGHAAGDVVLKAVADALQNAARREERVCRIGGEEFLIICPRTSAAGATAAAERMRRAVGDQSIRGHGGEYRVTLSAGVAERDEAMTRPDDLLKAADDMLYAAKEAGRNRIRTVGAPAETDPAAPASRAGQPEPAAASP